MKKGRPQMPRIEHEPIPTETDDDRILLAQEADRIINGGEDEDEDG